MTSNHSGRRLLLLVAVSVGILIAGTGAVVACETCADREQSDEDYEPFWSDEEFPYDTSENRSFVEIVIEETEREMEEDFGGENGSREATAGASVGNLSVDASAKADASPPDANATDGGATVAVEVEAVVEG